MTNFGNFGPILIKIGGEVYFILTNSILLSNTGTGKILSVRNSVVDPYTVQILVFNGISVISEPSYLVMSLFQDKCMIYITFVVFRRVNLVSFKLVCDKSVISLSQSGL